MAGRIVEVPLAWEIVHNELIDLLPGFAPGWVDLQAHQIRGPAYSEFTLNNHELGAHGLVKVKKIAPGLTTVSFSGPPRPSDEDVFRREAAWLKPPLRSTLLEKLNEGHPSQVVALYLYEGIDLNARRNNDELAWRVTWPRSLTQEEKTRLKTSALRKRDEARQSLYWDRIKHLDATINVWHSQFLHSNVWSHAHRQETEGGIDLGRRSIEPDIGRYQRETRADTLPKAKGYCGSKLPKKLKTRQKYARIYYNLVEPKREQYYEAIGRAPHVTEMKDAIVPELGARYSVGEKTLSKIIAIGDDGCLEPYKEEFLEET